MEENKKTTENRGGARRGAGRKPIGGKAYTFKAYPNVAAILDSYKGNKTQLINDAILQYLKG
ncbi:MAG: hypothetical protein NC115_12085 [Bacteroidales bacterium]|nr:hypothetical protein [Bacteroidales bacterium]